ncbi:MAG: very short patch repair endonuclease [Treponema sp.]|nr:very short patch repair endonuclease [Treponema sp.]MCL2250632.1 very short patch repair endonuclease [Treponema sp.]
MDTLTPEQRRKCMSRIKSKDTTIETLLRKALWHEGIRYRKNYKKLPGKPDIAITKYKIAIFCDGELWHGKGWDVKKDTIESNREYWIRKIEHNINRDNKIEKELERLGWIVVRFWGQKIKKNLIGCVNEIKEIIYEVKNGIYYPDECINVNIAVESESEYS